MRVLQTTTDNRRRRQTPETVTSLALYTRCRRASNKQTNRFATVPTADVVAAAAAAGAAWRTERRSYRDLCNLKREAFWRIKVDAERQTPSRQSAYRVNHSMENAVLHVLSDILDALDKGDFAVLTLLDFSAAFDAVDHATLLRRLKTTYGITGTALVWFTSYLHERKSLSVREDPAKFHHCYCMEFHKDQFSDRSCFFCTRQIYSVRVLRVSDSLMEWSCSLQCGRHPDIRIMCRPT